MVIVFTYLSRLLFIEWENVVHRSRASHHYPKKNEEDEIVNILNDKITAQQKGIWDNINKRDGERYRQKHRM